MKTRRDFIIQSTLTATGFSLGLSALTTTNAIGASTGTVESDNAMKISVFSKNLQWLGYEEMAIEVAAMGFDGIDLTVRPSGHVLPERVEEDLPKAVNVIRKHGLEVYMITTAITNSNDQHAEQIIKTASQLGIKYYRLGWFVYDKNLSIPANINNFHNTFRQLEKLNKRYHIHGAYQNHAGDGFGSAVVDLSLALKDIDPAWIGCQYDIRHATVEGAHSWPVGLQLLNDHVKTINIKDFHWAKKDGQWKEENVALGEGMVDFKKYLGMLKTYNYKGPVCIHYEYPLGGAEDGATKLTVPKEKVFEEMRSDLRKLKQWIVEAGFN
jgi:sugar phosphate isomerase/epimerase